MPCASHEGRCRTVLGMSSSSDRLAWMWQADAPRVLSYARRHVGLNDAPDVVSETFVVAWRRLSQVPEPALPWLIGTARRIIDNTRRSDRRRMGLVEKVEEAGFGGRIDTTWDTATQPQPSFPSTNISLTASSLTASESRATSAFAASSS